MTDPKRNRFGVYIQSLSLFLLGPLLLQEIMLFDLEDARNFQTFDAKKKKNAHHYERRDADNRTLTHSVSLFIFQSTANSRRKEKKRN